jgi:lipopolysaccharide/colanic/teichoic acid biosynthesis glycosyltransferase
MQPDTPTGPSPGSVPPLLSHPFDVSPITKDETHLQSSVPSRTDRLTASGLRNLVKRAIDVTGALVGLVLLAPALTIIAVLIRMDSPGPVIFRQLRRGYRGRLFQMFKFRTMTVDAEQRLSDLESSNELQGGVLFKLREDPRVTRLGSYLRRSGLDELPQLINVLLGQMSLVGPRPLQLRDSDRLLTLDFESYQRRLEVLPGVTGPWQVGGRSELNHERMVQLDVDYVNNWSLGRDLAIIYKTFLVMGFRVLSAEISSGVRTQEYRSGSTTLRREAPSEQALASNSCRIREELKGQIECGETVYPLLRPVMLTLKSRPDETWESCAEGLGIGFIGQGRTQQEAASDWREQVHVAFQRLYRKMAFEMSTDEQIQWDVLEKAIDVAAYRASRPLVLRQIGQVSRVRPNPSEIVWFDRTVEEIPLVELPADFARLESGQWFEAIVERDKATGRLKKMRYVHLIQEVEPMTPERARAFWASLPTTASLPQSTRDWTR